MANHSAPTGDAASKPRKGIVLAGGSGTRLHPCTLAISKQLLPVYDKPMIYYPLSTLMLAGLQDILIISTPHDTPLFQRLLGDGSQWGLRLEYAVQPQPEGLAQAFLIGESFLDGAPSCLILGDNIFYGHDLPKQLTAASQRTAGASIFTYHVSDPERYGVAVIDDQGRVVELEEKPLRPRSNWAVTGLYFYDQRCVEFAKQLRPSRRGELEITDLNRLYMQAGDLQCETLGRGHAWLDTGTHASLHDAASYIEVLERRQGLKIACLEEIAWRMRFISTAQLGEAAERLGKSTYADYLRLVLSSEAASRNAARFRIAA